MCSRPRQEREIRHFHVVVVERRLRNVQKSVIHVQIVIFQSKPIGFCRSGRRRCYLSSLLSSRERLWLL